jgi:hypothetical protein
MQQPVQLPMALSKQGRLLKHLDCADTQVIVNPDMDAAKEELEKSHPRYNKLNSALEMKYKELEIKAKSGSMTKSQWSRISSRWLKMAIFTET